MKKRTAVGLVLSVGAAGAVVVTSRRPENPPTPAEVNQDKPPAHGGAVSGDPMAEQIRTIVVRQLGVDRGRIVDEADFTTDLGGDSLDFVEFIMELEETFDLEVPDNDAGRLCRVGGAIAYVRERTKGR